MRDWTTATFIVHSGDYMGVFETVVTAVFEFFVAIAPVVTSVAAFAAVAGLFLIRKQWRADSLHREHMELLSPEIREALRTIFAADPKDFLDVHDVRLRNAAEKVLDMYDLIARRAKAGTIPKQETIDSEWPTVLRVAQQLGRFIDQETEVRKTDYKEGFKWLVSELRKSDTVTSKLPRESKHAWTELPTLPIRANSGYRNSRPCVAVGVVSNAKVLLLRRAKDPGKGKWELPGGFLEEGEHPWKGACRELQEETTFELVSPTLCGIHVGEYQSERANYKTLNICYQSFLPKWYPPEHKPTLDPKESTDYKWFPLDRVLCHVLDNYPLAFPWMKAVVQDCGRIVIG